MIRKLQTLQMFQTVFENFKKPFLKIRTKNCGRNEKLSQPYQYFKTL